MALMDNGIPGPTAPAPAAQPQPQAAAGPRPRLVVMLVHGTFARGLVQQARRDLRAAWLRLRGKPLPAEAALWPGGESAADEGALWFQARSPFEQTLASLLSERGLPPGSVVFDRIVWSGRNSFADREAAAATLRQALEAARRDHPASPLAVVAHSHGGTVAVKALDQGRPGGAPAVQGLLTMGSPFVRLAERDPPAAPATPTERRQATFRDAVATLLPGTLLALAPLAALAQAWLAETPTGLGLAAALGLAGLGAALTASVLTAYLLVVGLLWLGGGALWSFIPALAILALAAPLFIYKQPLAVAGWRHVERGPLRLACPLLALRTPRDEASLVIGLGHWGARLVGLFWAPVSRGIAGGAALPRPRRALRGFAVAAAALAVVLAVGGLGLLQAQGADRIGTGWGGWWAAGALSAGHGATLLLLAPLLLLLAWAVPTAAISLAAGKEAFMLPAVTMVEAEPLPHAVGADGAQPAAMSLEILYGARPGGLNHSLYEAALVQRRVADWLRDQAAAD